MRSPWLLRRSLPSLRRQSRPLSSVPASSTFLATDTGGEVLVSEIQAQIQTVRSYGPTTSCRRTTRSFLTATAYCGWARSLCRAPSSAFPISRGKGNPFSLSQIQRATTEIRSWRSSSALDFLVSTGRRCTRPHQRSGTDPLKCPCPVCFGCVHERE